MRVGVVAYVPPYWGHCTVNIGKGNYVFLSVFAGDAGYDCKTIAKCGFASIVIEREGRPAIVSNPRYLTIYYLPTICVLFSNVPLSSGQLSS
jgi:glucose-6-phosphate isomerase